MPSISACPQCQRNILIYSLASPSQRLRCPHCKTEFALQAVLSNCVELPPIAEPIDEFASAPPWSPLTFTAPPVPEGGVVVAGAAAEKNLEQNEQPKQEPATGAEQSIADSVAAATNVAESATTAGETVMQVTDSGSMPAATSDVTPATSPEVTSAVTSGETPPPIPSEFLASATNGAAVAETGKPASEVQAEAEGKAQPQDSEAASAESADESTAEEAPAEEYAEESVGFGGAVAIQRGPRRPKQGVGWFGQLVALVLGGVMGLSIGYYALLWIGGRDKDFLNVADKLPSWAVPKKVRRWDAFPSGREASGRSLGDLLNAPDTPAQPSTPGASNSAGVRATEFDGKGVDLAVDFHPGPRNFIPYNAAQLSQAISDVDQLLGCDHCGSTGFIVRTVSVKEEKKEPASRQADAKTIKTAKKIPCEECHGKPTGRITPEVYEKLCKLAETVCFAKIGDEDPNLPALRQSVLSVVGKAGSDNSKTQVIGRLAGYLLENGHREQNGIVLAGKLQEVVREGELFRLRIVLFGVPKTVTVVSHLMPNPPLKPQDRVIILGSIVDDPANNLAGYSGQLPQIVWGGLPWRLQNDLP